MGAPFNPKINVDVNSMQSSQDVRHCFLNIEIQSTNMTLVNIYAPNEENWRLHGLDSTLITKITLF